MYIFQNTGEQKMLRLSLKALNWIIMIQSRVWRHLSGVHTRDKSKLVFKSKLNVAVQYEVKNESNQT